MNDAKEWMQMRVVKDLSWRFVPTLAAEGPERCLTLMNQIINYLQSKGESHDVTRAKIARNGGNTYTLQKQLEEVLYSLYNGAYGESITVFFEKILFPVGFIEPAQEIYKIYRERLRDVYEKPFCGRPPKGLNFPYLTEEQFAAMLPKGNIIESGSIPMEIDDPFANAFAEQDSMREQTVADFLTKTDYEHFRNGIFVAMDNSMGWVRYLSVKKLLVGDVMEKEVARLKTAWESNRGGKPTLTILTGLARNSKFASQDLRVFIRDLLNLNIESVQVAALELQTWLTKKLSEAESKSQQTFDTQSILREWFIRHKICPESNVDNLILKVQNDGVESLDDLKFMTVDNLKECGFNTVQANKLLKSFEIN